MRQKLIWGRRDLRPPRDLIQAIANPDPVLVEKYFLENADWVWAENLFALACRVPNFEGHGGQIPEEAKHQSERIELVGLFLRFGGDPNVRNRRKVTPLHTCCRFDLPRVAEFLLNHGADPNVYDEARETPLYRAVNLGYVECAKVMLAAPVDLNFQNRKGHTVLHRAAMRGKRFIVPLLLTANAKVDVEDKQGKIAIDYARNKTIIQLLEGAT